MARRGIVFILAGLLLGGCMQVTIDPQATRIFRRAIAGFWPTHRISAFLPVAYQRSMVEYHRKEAPARS
jgi:hypothetical protein